MVVAEVSGRGKPMVAVKRLGSGPENHVAHSGVGSAKEQAAYAELFTRLRKANSGADAEAERECLAAETDEPSTARFALGLLAKRRGKSSEARRSFSAAVEAAPTIPDNHNY